jgi:hypothetical protein
VRDPGTVSCKQAEGCRSNLPGQRRPVPTRRSITSNSTTLSSTTSSTAQFREVPVCSACSGSSFRSVATGAQ